MLDGEGKKLKVVLAELDNRRHKEREEKLRIQKENEVAAQHISITEHATIVQTILSENLK